MKLIDPAKQPDDLEKLPDLSTGQHYYWFDQNNSGGYYTKPAQNVFVQAENKEIAAMRLSQMEGFTTKYCSCCGPRWDRGFEEKMTRDELLDYVKSSRAVAKKERHGEGEIPAIIIAIV